jgi:hypothetical protein
MPNKDTPYQTLDSFLETPFGKQMNFHPTDMENKYKEVVRNKSIRVENYTIIDDMYLVHLKMESDSQKGNFYDIVIAFFTPDEDIAKSSSLKNYLIQFYSNSPSFIYKYAALYKLHGYLIDSLYEKMDKEHSNIFPDKTNPNYDMTYDKSLYCACRFIQDNKFSYMRKDGLKVFTKKVNVRDFLHSISDYDEIKMNSELANLEKALAKENKDEKENANRLKNLFVRDHSSAELEASRSKDSGKNAKKTAKDHTNGMERAVSIVKKIVPKLSTSKGQSSVRVVKKKRAGTSTNRK